MGGDGEVSEISIFRARIKIEDALLLRIAVKSSRFVVFPHSSGMATELGCYVAVVGCASVWKMPHLCNDSHSDFEGSR